MFLHIGRNAFSDWNIAQSSDGPHESMTAITLQMTPLPKWHCHIFYVTGSHRDGYLAAKCIIHLRNIFMYEVLVFAFLTLVCLLPLRHFFVRTVLDNVPGPSPSSFWSGETQSASNPFSNLSWTSRMWTRISESQSMGVSSKIDGNLLVLLSDASPIPFNLTFITRWRPIQSKGSAWGVYFNLILNSLSLKRVPVQHLDCIRPKGCSPHFDQGE